MKHRIEETIDVLISAFFKNKLRHGDACECAVGNLIRSKSLTERDPYEWYLVLHDEVYSLFMRSQGRRELKLLPYRINEIRKIERSFEDHRYHDPDGFLGLCNLFDVLANDIDRDYFDQRGKVSLIGILQGAPIEVVEMEKEGV